MTDEAAVREVGWVAREARHLTEATPGPGASAAERSLYGVRWALFVCRKRALLDHIEGTS